MKKIQITIDSILNLTSSLPILIITVILALDSIRSVLAATINIDPNSFWGKIIYGRRDTRIVQSAFQDLGFSNEKTINVVKKIKDVAKSAEIVNSAVSQKDAAIQLIITLAKYTVKFNSPISYGGNLRTQSDYYIDTMEIVHDSDDRQRLTAIMIRLIKAKTGLKKTPSVVYSPKGGNPIFSDSVASVMGSHLVIAKSDNDKSRISVSGDPYEEFFVNYEGSWIMKSGRKDTNRYSYLIDCNTSGGTQLIDILNKVRSMSNNIHSTAPSEAYVLFKADINDDDTSNIDDRFSAQGCKLYRFFDLDETAKGMMYEMRENCKNRQLDVFNDEDRKCAEEIIEYLKKHKLYKYN